MKTKIHLTALMLVISACGNKQVNTAKSPSTGGSETEVTLTNAQFKNAGIVTEKIMQKEISSTLKLNGKIDVPPQNMVSVNAPLGGYLKSTGLLPGAHVKKGEIIAVMEDYQYIQLQQDYLTAKAKFPFLEKEYQRQKELNQNKAASDKVFQQAEADYRANQILVTSLTEKLKLTGINPNNISETRIVRYVNIYSPINGFVSKVNVNIGKYVSASEILFQLVDPTDIHLALKVFEKDLSKLYIGQNVMAYTNNQPDKKYKCSVLLIGHDLSPDRNADVHCHFAIYDKSLVPGTYMNAEVQIKNLKTSVLPTEAVVQFEGKSYGFMQTGNKTYRMIEINIGDSEDGFTQIDLTNQTQLANALFVTKGAYSLLMMLKNKAD